MTAVDTDVLVRLLTGDDPRQETAARVLFESGQIWIAKTVLLETAWVLRSLYNFEEGEIRDAFIRLLGLKAVSVEDVAAVASALAVTSSGIEFADALHLTSRPAGAAFVSFDRSLINRAARAGINGVHTVPLPE